MDGGSLGAYYGDGLQPGRPAEATVPSELGDLRDLSAVKVFTDGSGTQKGWGMAALAVENLATQQRWVFDQPQEITPDGALLQRVGLPFPSVVMCLLLLWLFTLTASVQETMLYN